MKAAELNTTEEIKNQLQAEIDWVEEYYTAHPDSPAREFVSSAYYGEGELNLDYIEVEEKENIEKLKALMGDSDLRLFLIDSSDTIYEPSFYRVKNSILSAKVGEIECEISNELYNKIKSLTEAERQEINKEKLIKSFA